MNRAGIQTTCTLLLIALTAISAGALTLDDFAYDNSAAAAEQWVQQGRSPRVQKAGDSNGMVFTCPFKKKIDRAYWQKEMTLYLSSFTSFEIDLSCPMPEAIRSLAVFFKSGPGWYVWNKPIPKTGRQKLTLPKSAFSTEGEPAGWDRVEAIRFSPWKGSPIDTEITLFSMAARKDAVLLVQGTSSLPTAADRRVGRQVAERLSGWLTNMGIDHGLLTDDDVTAKSLAGARVVILPFNQVLSSTERRALSGFAGRGGKLIVFYSGDRELARLMDVKLAGTETAGRPGRWASFSFTDQDNWRVPKRIYQDSWILIPVHPASRKSKVIAWWEDALGKRTPEPAWVAGEHGAWMTHIFQVGDNARKEHLLAGLIGAYYPEIWPRTAAAAMERAARIAPAATFQETLTTIRERALGTPNEDPVHQKLVHAQRIYKECQFQLSKEGYTRVMEQSRVLRALLEECNGMTFTGKAGEFRGVWDHKGSGLYPGNWDRTCKELADAGFTAVFANVAWGGLAHYDSKVLPHSDTFRKYGDQLAQLATAAKKHGLQVHAWLVCWNLSNAPVDFVHRMKREGRLQAGKDGNTIRWLNPAHPKNVDLTLRVLKEMAGRYDIDGVHLDYIRYPNSMGCYSEFTKNRFEDWLKRPVIRWPDDVLYGGKLFDAYRRFRADQINLVVRAVRRELKDASPNVKISAAVFGKYPDCKVSVGQDWGSWLKNLHVDFVTPMNYTDDTDVLAGWVGDQLKLPNAHHRVYPGLGVTASESQLTSDQVIQQIEKVRRQTAAGFVLFDLDHYLVKEILPVLKLGITRPGGKRSVVSGIRQ